MNISSIKRHVAVAAYLLGIFIVSWVIPPVVHRMRHLCPVRPDGVGQAFAVPGFSRKYGVSCSQCHYGFPVLNAFGREFKSNGYVMGRDDDQGVLKSADGTLWTEKLFPWGLIVRSRPFDNGRGNVSNQGAQNGGTPMNNPRGFKMQPVNDVDFFFAGGDAAKHVSWYGEMDANAVTAATAFSAGLGDLRLGYHPSPYYNVVAERKGFYADDPYQTISSMQSPTLTPRSVDLMMTDQGSISMNQIGASQQVLALYGQATLPNSHAFLYYSVGASKDSDAGRQSAAPTNGNIRLALDDTAHTGLMLGVFSSYGHETNTAFGLGIAGPLANAQFVRGGLDGLWEMGDLVARGAFAYLHDGDPAVRGAVATDRAAYVEAAYYYKRADNASPFLVPLLRENWYTTFNGRQHFNYITMQLAHFFAANVKAFVEYSVDTKRGYQGGSLPLRGYDGTWALLGNRATAQIEVGF